MYFKINLKQSCVSTIFYCYVITILYKYTFIYLTNILLILIDLKRINEFNVKINKNNIEVKTFENTNEDLFGKMLVQYKYSINVQYSTL